ncbi:hypothetical protein BC831DRAFT_480512 [Entophlyctis helioformis]|nr:hypothetical protein BC831DRAFT_480512 [Entophlyctis helioformis]
MASAPTFAATSPKPPPSSSASVAGEALARPPRALERDKHDLERKLADANLTNARQAEEMEHLKMAMDKLMHEQLEAQETQRRLSEQQRKTSSMLAEVDARREALESREMQLQSALYEREQQLALAHQAMGHSGAGSRPGSPTSMAAAVAAREAQVEHLAAELHDKETALKFEAEAITQKRSLLDQDRHAHEQIVVQQMHELESERHALAEESAQLDQLKQKLAEKDALDTNGQIVAERQELLRAQNEHEAALAALRADRDNLAQHRHHLETEAASLESQRQQLAHDRNQLDHDRHLLQQREEALGNSTQLQHVLEQESAHLQQQRATLMPIALLCVSLSAKPRSRSKSTRPRSRRLKPRSMLCSKSRTRCTNRSRLSMPSRPRWHKLSRSTMPRCAVSMSASSGSSTTTSSARKSVWLVSTSFVRSWTANAPLCRRSASSSATGEAALAASLDSAKTDSAKLHAGQLAAVEAARAKVAASETALAAAETDLRHRVEDFELNVKRVEERLLQRESRVEIEFKTLESERTAFLELQARTLRQGTGSRSGRSPSPAPDAGEVERLHQQLDDTRRRLAQTETELSESRMQVQALQSELAAATAAAAAGSRSRMASHSPQSPGQSALHAQHQAAIAELQNQQQQHLASKDTDIQMLLSRLQESEAMNRQAQADIQALTNLINTAPVQPLSATMRPLPPPSVASSVTDPAWRRMSAASTMSQQVMDDRVQILEDRNDLRGMLLRNMQEMDRLRQHVSLADLPPPQQQQQQQSLGRGGHSLTSLQYSGYGGSEAAVAGTQPQEFAQAILELAKTNQILMTRLESLQSSSTASSATAHQGQVPLSPSVASVTRSAPSTVQRREAGNLLRKYSTELGGRMSKHGSTDGLATMVGTGAGGTLLAAMPLGPVSPQSAVSGSSSSYGYVQQQQQQQQQPQQRPSTSQRIYGARSSTSSRSQAHNQQQQQHQVDLDSDYSYGDDSDVPSRHAQLQLQQERIAQRLSASALAQQQQQQRATARKPPSVPGAAAASGPGGPGGPGAYADGTSLRRSLANMGGGGAAAAGTVDADTDVSDWGGNSSTAGGGSAQAKRASQRVGQRPPTAAVAALQDVASERVRPVRSASVSAQRSTQPVQPSQAMQAMQAVQAVPLRQPTADQRAALVLRGLDGFLAAGDVVEQLSDTSKRILFDRQHGVAGGSSNGNGTISSSSSAATHGANGVSPTDAAGGSRTQTSEAVKDRIRQRLQERKASATSLSSLSSLAAHHGSSSIGGSSSMNGQQQQPQQRY